MVNPSTSLLFSYLDVKKPSYKCYAPNFIYVILIEIGEFLALEGVS